MGMASGESDVHFGTDVGQGALKPAEGGQKLFYPMCLPSKCSHFVENSSVGEKHHFDPLARPPSRPVAAGPSIFHLSLRVGGS